MIINERFPTLSETEIQEVNGGVGFIVIGIVAGVVIAASCCVGAYNGYMDTKDQKNK